MIKESLKIIKQLEKPLKQWPEEPTSNTEHWVATCAWTHVVCFTIRANGGDKVTITVSFGSSSESLTILAIVIVPDVDPALIVRVPLARV